jgi:hypothetical protein
MKTNKLSYFTSLLILLSGWLANAQAPVLGTAADFVIFSTDGAVTSNVTNSLMTHLTGNVGTNTSGATSTGFGNVNGVMQDNNIASSLAAADLLIAYNQLNALIPNFFPSALLGNGSTFVSGIYFINSTAVLDGNLILDGQNNPNALFVIQINGAFSTNSLSEVTLTNGALACNVFWKVEGLVDMSAGTLMKGTIVANNAAILMGVGSKIEGRLLSTTGAITVNGVEAKLPLGCGTPVLNGPTAPNLASTICYAIFSGENEVTNAGVTTVLGDVGTNVGLTTGFNALDVTGTIHPIPDVSTAQCAADLLDVRTYLNALTPDIELLYPAQFGNDLLLTPHTYIINGATVFTDTLFLDAQNNANAVFVIKIFGALATTSLAKVTLLNGAQAKNIYWIVNGAVSLSTFTEFKGTLIVNNGAISAATGAIVEGRLMTTSGAVTTFSITDNMTVGCPPLAVTTNSKVNELIVYPNPFSKTLTLQVNENNINSEFILYDVLGKTIIQKKINQTSTSIEVNVTPGMYFYKFTNSAGLLQTGKLIAK